MLSPPNGKKGAAAPSHPGCRRDQIQIFDSDVIFFASY